jgi:polyribonucleotide nucleotidyltransferase
MSYPTYPNTYTKEVKVGDKTITIEVGKFSEQVSAAVLTTCGETVVHTTVALGRKVNLGYFPLSVEFAEKLYAGGIIKGSRWVKRDGRPTDDAILRGRVIDRTMRPMFPDGVTHEVQVISTVFSYDGVNEPDMLGLLGAGIGLAVSEIPFEGPVAGLRVGYSKEAEKFMFNPTVTEEESSDLDLIVSGTADSIVMVEAGANEINEDIMVEALTQAHTEIQAVCKQIDAIVAEIGKEKIELVSEEDVTAAAANEALAQDVMSTYETEIKELVRQKGRLQAYDYSELLASDLEKRNAGNLDKDGNPKEGAEIITESQLKSAFELAMKKMTRKMVLESSERPDGRGLEDIRPIWTEVDVFPRTHGSAMFKRGATQAVTVATLGAPSLGQLIEDMTGEETRYYMHHYNMPPYASGEAGRFGFPKRREIGHGALAERALFPMLPAQSEFPYAIHVVSEIMSSNGSTSQASVCGSTMALMAAGVPIKRPVAGIAMGLMSDGKNFAILSDIQGLEDYTGDMDFKVAGTTEGITAIQMDIKLKGLPREILTKALKQAYQGRDHILNEMLKTIAEPRKELSTYAPKIVQVEIPQDRIGELIGPGGKNIKALIEMSGAQIDVDEDEERRVGLVNISSPDQASIDKAATYINSMMRTVEVGEEFDGMVTRVEAYGAFVEYLPDREGLVHVSQMSTEFVENADDIVKVGDDVHVRVSEIKDDGKIALSMLSAEEAAQSGRGGGREGGRDGGNRGGGDRSRGGRDGGRGGDRGGNRGGGYGGSRGGSSRGGNDRGDRGNRGGGSRNGGSRSGGSSNSSQSSDSSKSGDTYGGFFR